MASTRNAFDLLGAGGESLQGVASAAAAKKQCKKKGKGGAAGGAAAAEEPAITQQQAAEPAAAPQQQLSSAKEAGDALEAAAIAAAPGERGALAQDWVDQVGCGGGGGWSGAHGSRTSARGRAASSLISTTCSAQPRTAQVQRGDAVFADGAGLVDFRQVLLKCRAVPALLEGCASRGAAPGDAPALARLLAAVAHPSVPRAYCDAVAEATAGLGGVAGADPLAPLGAAKRALGAAVGLALRGIPKPPAAKPTEPPGARLKRLGAELGRQEARLPATTQPKELCKVRRRRRRRARGC